MIPLITPRVGRWLWPVAGLAVALAWALAATYDQPRPRAAAAAVAAMITATVVPKTLESTLAAVVLLGVFPLAMTRPALLALSFVVVAAAELAGDRRVERIANLVGAALVSGSLLYTAVDGFGWRLTAQSRPAAALALAGVLVLLAGTSPMLMVPGALVASAAAPILPATEVAVACALAAVGLAAFDRPGPAAAALGLPAAPLLLAGVLVRRRVEVLALLPGAVALVAVLSTQRLSGATAALGAGLAATAALVAWRPEASAPPVTRRDLPVLTLLVWLALAPSTWRWAGRFDLTEYERGIAIALAAAAFAIVATSLRRPRHGISSSTS